MVTIKDTWIGFVVLFLVMVLVVAAAIYWHHITGASVAHLLVSFLQPSGTGQGC
jgi:hypothetical protein